MATTTTKLALTKPDGTDLVDIAVLNTNADKIDAASGATICTSTTRPASPWNGQIIFETDTLGGFVWRSSTSSWTSLGGSTVSSDPPATAANGDLWWDSDNGKLYIYYVDANSSQWVSVMPATTTVEVAQNVIINGAFDIWQRGTSFTGNVFSADRWYTWCNSGTLAVSRQAFSPGELVIPSFGEPNYYLRHAWTAGNGYSIIEQKIEDVKTLAGQTVTVSFWAKANATISTAPEIEINFGQGGSTSVFLNPGAISIGTSWAKYSFTVNIPSTSGKTIGVSNHLIIRPIRINGTTSHTIDIWGVQFERGSVATAFRRNQPNIQAELAACQRYYTRYQANGDYAHIGTGISNNLTHSYVTVALPTNMRAAPTISEYVNLILTDRTNYDLSVTGFDSIYYSGNTVSLGVVHGSGAGTTRTACLVIRYGGSYIGFSAEL